MTLSSLPVTQRRLLVAIGDIAGYNAVTVSRWDFRQPLGRSDVERYEVAVAQYEIPSSDGHTLFMYASLPSVRDAATNEVPHCHSFLMLLDTDCRDVAQLVAYASAHDRFAGALGVEHTFKLGDNDSLRARGYSHAVVLGADYYAPFADNRNIQVDELHVTLFALVLLSAAERETKVAQGMGALFQRFEQQGRDLLSLEPALQVARPEC